MAEREVYVSTFHVEPGWERPVQGFGDDLTEAILDAKRRHDERNPLMQLHSVVTMSDAGEDV